MGRDKDCEVTVSFENDKTTFTRVGSFRQMTLTEKMADPQSAVVTESVPATTKAAADMSFAVPRPQTSAEMFERQGSFRGFPTLNESVSPFKRTLSVRVNDLPSNVLRRQRPNTANAPTIPENEILNTDDLHKERENAKNGCVTSQESANTDSSFSSSSTCPAKLSNYQSNNNIGNGISNLANGVEDDSPIEAFDPFNANWASRLAKEEPAKLPVTNQVSFFATNHNNAAAKNPFAQDVIAKTFE